MSTLTDDDLGARLRAALQGVSPLATDPVPPPRFAPTALTVAPASDPDDVLVLGLGERAVPGPRSRRRVAVGVGLLAVAAVATGALVATTDLGRRTPGTSTPATSKVTPTPFVTPSIPGVVPDTVPWRCTAPTGAVLSARLVADAYAPQVWQIGDGVSCAAYPADRGRYVIAADGHGVSVPGTPPATFGVSQSCFTAATQFQDDGFNVLTLRSRGSVDYLEFFGPNCRLLPAAK